MDNDATAHAVASSSAAADRCTWLDDITSPDSSQSTPPTTLDDAFSESDEDDEADLGPPDASGIRRRIRRSGDKRIRPAYYWPSGTLARGVPCFEPDEEEFADFNAFVAAVSKYGMSSGIVKVKPPESWSKSLPSVSRSLADVRLRDPIAQNFIGSSGLYRVANVAKSRIWNAKQWQQATESAKYAPPDFFRRRDAGDPTDAKEGAREPSEARSTPARASSSGPTSDELARRPEAAPAVEGDDSASVLDACHQLPSHWEASAAPMATAAKHRLAPSAGAASGKRKQTALQRADISAAEWTAWEGSWARLPHDYTPDACQQIERSYWRTLTFGEPPMYGADLKGSLFSAATTSWNVADLRDLLSRLGRYHQIPGVNTPYLYFGMWRATFAWHVEDADLYSINYIHFGAPKFWYSVPQHQADKFERVMSGWFPQERARCREFLRHKSYLASPTKLANEGVTLNKIVQLPGEFILTYPYGYHSGFNCGFNCAESINFADDAWLDMGRRARSCACVGDSVRIDVDEWLRLAAEGARAGKRHLNEPWFSRPRKQPRIEYDDPAAAARRAAQAAKRAAKEEAARRAAMRAPFVCVLCPDMSTETLVPLAPPPADARLGDEQQARRKAGAAHKACVMYVPSTYIDTDPGSGQDFVYGFDAIEKDRWKLKCCLCDDKYGCPVQCTKSAKCVRAQHVTCAFREDSGVVMDALLTAHGVERSLLAPEEGVNPTPSPSAAPDGTVRLVVHCRQHNPQWAREQANRKAAELAARVAALAAGSRTRLRVNGSTFDATFLRDRPEAGLIEVRYDNGQTMAHHYAALVWTAQHVPQAPVSPFVYETVAQTSTTREGPFVPRDRSDRLAPVDNVVAT